MDPFSQSKFRNQSREKAQLLVSMINIPTSVKTRNFFDQPVLSCHSL